jgi:hypothetical protein
MRTGYLRRVSVHRNPRWQNSAICDVIAATLPANNIELPTADGLALSHSAERKSISWLFILTDVKHIICIRHKKL